MALIITIYGGSVQKQNSKIWVKVHTDTVQGSFYKCLLRLTCTDTAKLPASQDEGITPDSNGDAWFEISGLLERELVPEFRGAGLHVEHAELPVHVKLDIGESYVPADPSQPRQENWAGLAGSQYELDIIDGRLTQQEQNQYSDAGTSWYAAFITAGKFLTQLVSGSSISPDGPLMLWWMTSASAQHALTLKADFTSEDGTTGTVSNAVTINPGIINQFNIDPGTLGLDVSSDNPVASYTVYLADGETPASEQFVFNIDYDYHEHNNYAFYYNREGGVDAVWLHGLVDYLFPVSTTTSERPAERTDTSLHRTVKVSTKISRRGWKISTGYKSIEEIKAMAALLEAKQVWLRVGSNIVPVNIENSEQLLASLENDIHSLDIEFLEAH